MSDSSDSDDGDEGEIFDGSGYSNNENDGPYVVNVNDSSIDNKDDDDFHPKLTNSGHATSSHVKILKRDMIVIVISYY